MLELLKSIGLTDSESKVYLALLDLGTVTVGSIADKSKVSYSKIYLLLEKLIEKGLVNYIMKEKTKYFTASNPKKILDYLNQKKSKLDILSDEVENILPQLTAKLESFQEKEFVTIYEGYEGLKTVYYEGLDRLKEGDEILVMGASLGNYTDKTRYPRLLKNIHEKREQKKIKMKIIFNENVKNDKEIFFYKNQKYVDMRFLLKNTPGSVNIQGNRVLIIYWHKEEAKTFVIQSSVVADSFRQYFNVLWNQAKK